MSFPSTGSPAAACRTSVLALPSRCWRCSVRQPRGPCKRGRGRRQASSAPCRDAGSEKWGHLPGHPAHLRLAGLQGLACSHHAVPPPPRADSGPLTCSRCGGLSFRDGWPPPPRAAGRTLRQVPSARASELFFLGLPPGPQWSPVPRTLRKTFSCSF